jgi:hypothetical protein
MQMFESQTNVLEPPPDAPLAVSNVSELCLETCVNVFGRDTFLAEKPNHDPWSHFVRRMKNRKQTDLRQ